MAPGRILAGALAAAAALLLLTLWVALYEPFLGVDLAPPADGGAGLRIVAAGGQAQAAGLRPGDRVRAVRGGGASFDIPAGWLVETPSYFIRYDDYNRFVAQQAVLQQVLRSAEVTLVRDDGAEFRVAPRSRPLAELPAAFWYQLLYALLALSVGAALLAFRSFEPAAQWYALASFGFFVGTLMRALYGSRELAIDPDVLRAALAIAHGGALVGCAALANFAWHFPRRLGSAPLPALTLGLALLAWIADSLQLAPSTNLAYRGPLLVLCALVIAFALLQWRTARRDPVRRVMARWLILMMVAGAGTWGAGLVVVALGHDLPIPRGTHGVSTVLLLYLGMVPLFLKHRAFDLERWWFEAWVWFLGGCLVVSVDLLLVYALSLHTATALALSLLIVGWLYFPLRQWLLVRLWRRPQRDLRELFPELVRVLLAPHDAPTSLEERWRELLQRVFEPRSIDGAARPASRVGIEEAGLKLVVPHAGGGGALELAYADGGSRLFSRRDARLATSLLDLLRQGSGYREGYWRGVSSERERIARDLHDDIGAKLLTLIHESSSERVTALARSAVAEMRDVVAGLRAEPQALGDALADWRAELAGRAAAAACRLDWTQPERLPEVLLSPRQQLNLARILREAASNALRHARAAVIDVHVRCDAGRLTLEMRHDGEVGVPSQWREGTGLATMRRRTRDLRGSIDWALETGGAGGTCLRLAVDVPFATERAT